MSPFLKNSSNLDMAMFLSGVISGTKVNKFFHGPGVAKRSQEAKELSVIYISLGSILESTVPTFVKSIV